MPQGTRLDLSRTLAHARQVDPLLGEGFQHLQDAINRLGQNLGASAVGELPPPAPVDSTSVSGALNTSTNTLTVSGELLHFVHTHNAPINRGIRYITEIDTDPSFPSPHPILDTTSRSGFVHLPTKDASNVPHSFYMRVTPQDPGSGPARPTVFGGLQGPTKIVLGGTTATDILPSQAAGTAKPGQGGQGLGAVRSRGPVGGPKRSLNK